AENGLAHASDHVTDHASWAVQDLVKKLKAAVEVFDKFAKKPGDPHAVRAKSTIASLEDKRADPQTWGDTLKLAAELASKAPPTVEIKTNTADYKANAQAALDWMKKNTPAAELLVRAAAKRIDIPGVKHPDDWTDLGDETILIPVDRAAWKPQ